MGFRTAFSRLSVVGMTTAAILGGRYTPSEAVVFDYKDGYCALSWHMTEKVNSPAIVVLFPLSFVPISTHHTFHAELLSSWSLH